MGSSGAFAHIKKVVLRHEDGGIKIHHNEAQKHRILQWKDFLRAERTLM